LVGSFRDENYVQKGFIYEDGQYIELLPPGWERAEAIAINDNGFVLGDGYDNGIEKCFIYKDGKYTELLPPRFSSADFARDINNNDVVLGSGFSIHGGYQRGFIVWCNSFATNNRHKLLQKFSNKTAEKDTAQFMRIL